MEQRNGRIGACATYIILAMTVLAWQFIGECEMKDK